MIDFIDTIKHFLGAGIVVPLVFFSGLYLSIKLRWLQLTHFKQGLRLLLKKSSESSAFSSFTAVAAILGGNLGTGNIAGIAIALSTGGPGALFWMWVMAFLGAIIKFCGCFLGVKYRKRAGPLWIGGPMYYLRDDLGFKRTAQFYCIFLIVAALTVGNLVQVNSVALPLHAAGLAPVWSGLVMAIFVGIVLLGGARRFARVTERIVPVMAFAYLIACVIILVRYNELIFPSLKLIWAAAWAPNAVLGGAVGFSLFETIRAGFDRGLFATDAGLGLEAILHAQVDKSPKMSLNAHAYTQGLITIVAPICVMVVCMFTGLVLLVTGVWQDHSLESTNLCVRAFQLGLKLPHAEIFLILTIFLFAFTTILTWTHCAEKAVTFLVPYKPMRAVHIFRWLAILCIPIGSFSSVRFVWTIADIANNLMLILNVVGILALSKEVFKGLAELRLAKK